jgi:NAD(P) transhydrogenase subunit alpha
VKIAVVAETAAGERRVSAIPETVKKLVALGAQVAVEAGAGVAASVGDDAFQAAGATIGDRAATVAGAGIVLGVQAPDPRSLAAPRTARW